MLAISSRCNLLRPYFFGQVIPHRALYEPHPSHTSKRPHLKLSLLWLTRQTGTLIFSSWKKPPITGLFSAVSSDNHKGVVLVHGGGRGRGGQRVYTASFVPPNACLHPMSLSEAVVVSTTGSLTSCYLSFIWKETSRGETLISTTLKFW